MFTDTHFAKIVTDTEGWDRIMLNGRIIALSVGDQSLNNEIVDAIVRGLRNQHNAPPARAAQVNCAAISAH